jgi:hypothetical protein
MTIVIKAVNVRSANKPQNSEEKMTIVQTYHTFCKKIMQLQLGERINRIRIMAWLMAGIISSRSVHLSHISNKIPGKAKRRSRTRQLARFIDNKHIRVRGWYEPIARQLLEKATQQNEWVRLIIDCSKVGNGHQLCMVALAYRRRALPIVWTWVRSKRGHSSGPKQRALLAYVQQLMPAEAQVVVTGDSEFTPLQATLEEWGWFYALRQKGSYLLRSSDSDNWQRCDSLVTKSGQRRWLSSIQFTAKYKHACNFLALWQKGEPTPWLLATNLPTPYLTRLHYSRRMWIEEMFGDFKAHGFDLEMTRLRHFQRLSRLTLAVALLYVWLVAFGSKGIKAGQRHLVDRNDRRDLSIFRIGFDLFDRFIVNEQSFSVPSVPYF